MWGMILGGYSRQMRCALSPHICSALWTWSSHHNEPRYPEMGTPNAIKCTCSGLQRFLLHTTGFQTSIGMKKVRATQWCILWWHWLVGSLCKGPIGRDTWNLSISLPEHYGHTEKFQQPQTARELYYKWNDVKGESNLCHLSHWCMAWLQQQQRITEEGENKQKRRAVFFQKYSL